MCMSMQEVLLKGSPENTELAAFKYTAIHHVHPQNFCFTMMSLFCGVLNMITWANRFSTIVTEFLNMNSTLESNLYEVSVLEIQNFRGFDKPEASQQQQKIPDDVPLAYPLMAKSTATEINEMILNEGDPSELFDVVIEDGIRAVAPVTTTWPESGLELEQQPESSRAPARKRQTRIFSQIDEIVEPHEQAYNRSPTKKKHRRTATNAKETNELILQLFMSGKPKEYVLEMHEVKARKVKPYLLIGRGENGQWNVEVSNYKGGEYVKDPVLEDPCIPVLYEKYRLGLQDRLRGWSVECKARKQKARGTGVKLYYHMGRQYRSLVEVGRYILYSCKQKDLQNLRTERVPNLQVVDAAKVTMDMPIKQGNNSAENLNMDNPPKEIEVPTASNAIEVTTKLSSEQGNGSTEDLTMNSLLKEIIIPNVIMEPQTEGRDPDEGSSKASPQQFVSCEEDVIQNTNHSPVDNELSAVDVIDPPERRKDEPEENEDANVESPQRTFEEEDDIFSNLPHSQNIEIEDENVGCPHGSEKEDDIFSNLPEIQSLENVD